MLWLISTLLAVWHAGTLRGAQASGIVCRYRAREVSPAELGASPTVSVISGVRSDQDAEPPVLLLSKGASHDDLSLWYDQS